MARRYVDFCDHPHKADIGEHEGITRTYGENGQWWVAEHCDLADKHMQEMFDHFKSYARVYKEYQAVPVDKKTTGKIRPQIEGAKHPYDRPCLFCEVVTTKSGVSSHLESAHGFQGLTEAYGLVCPLCLETALTKLGSHGVKEHGVKSVPELFKVALAEGDPHGIVAARLALAAPVKAIEP